MICLIPINDYYINANLIVFLADKHPAIGKDFCKIGMRGMDNITVDTNCEVIKKQIYKTCKDN